MAKTLSFLSPAIGALCLDACLRTAMIESSPAAALVPWDTSFTISGVRFPNDTLFENALGDAPSNSRLRKFIGKCATQGSVKVGFIGGSITVGAKSSSPSLRYSSIFCASIRKAFPNLKLVTEINAGISATTSRFGCSRAQADLLSQAPDLIVIDFAVNDLGAGDVEFRHRTMEGLVRQCLAFRNDVPIILLSMSGGDGTNAQKEQADVGAYYSLPMISYRDAIWPLIASKRVPWDAFFSDNPHPNDNGHLACAYLLYSYLKSELSRPEGPAITFPAFRYSDLYQSAAVLTSGDSAVSASGSGWQSYRREDDRIGFSSGVVPHSVLTLKTDRREMTLGIRMQAADTSSIRITVDGGRPDTLGNAYVFTYTKFLTLFAAEPAATHEVRIENLGAASFYLDYVLYAGPGIRGP